MSKHIGNQRPVKQAGTLSYSPATGWVSAKSYIGTDEEIRKLAAQIKKEKEQETEGAPAAVNLSVSPIGGGLSQLDASYDNDIEETSTTTTWSLQANEYEKDIWSHPTVRSLYNLCPTEYKWLRENLPIVREKGTWTDVLNAWSCATASDQCCVSARNIFTYFRDGIENYIISSYVLRKSISMPVATNTTYALANVNKRVSVAQMTANEGVPTGLVFALPNYGEWLKKAPSVNYERGKIQIDQEYAHAEDWNDWIYAAATY